MQTRRTAKPAPPSSTASAAVDPLTDALGDPLANRGAPTSTRTEITAGTRPDPGDPPKLTKLDDGTPYVEYPKQDKVVRGSSQHDITLNEWADGSALVANSSNTTGTTSDAASLYEAYAGYSDEHPDWSRERRLAMASREDWNEGGDVVSAKRRDGGGAPRTGGKWAAVIGNNAYKKLGVLNQPIPDAKGMGGRWDSEGFPVREYFDVGASSIQHVFEQIPKYAQRGDDVRVFFAGHGLASYGLAGVNAKPSNMAGIPFVDDCVPFAAVGNLASAAVSNGWHLTAIIDACASGEVATSVQDALIPDTESSRTTDYDINLTEMAEKGLPTANGRYKGLELNEMLFKRFVNRHGHFKYGKEGAQRLLDAEKKRS